MTAPTEDSAARVPGRALAIAAIHAYAEWLAEHPEVPIPGTLAASHHVDFSLPVSERAAVVERFAAAHEIEVWRRGKTVGARLTVMSSEYPVEIDHSVLASTIDRPL